MPATTSVTVRTPGLVLVEHEVPVPLDHDRPDGPSIPVFAREVADPDGLDRPFLLFLQGGPGNEAPRPTGSPMSPGWLERALADHRVLMLDQRGTGRSAPVGDLPGMSPAQQAEHLTRFRADSIVRDAEAVREALGVRRWSVLGQSFGGFCALTYLSIALESLDAAYVTGGLPPVGRSPDEVYAATWARHRELVERHYARCPSDRERVLALHRRLSSEPLALPGGDFLTARRFRSAGHGLGMSDGSDRLHGLLELPADSPAFRADAADLMGFARNPLYAVLHEACYADGATTAWSADRTRPAAFDEDPSLLFGEHVHPWVLDDVGALAPLRDAALLLADHPWPRLYDPAQLAVNEVPVAAAVYAEDPYVEATFSLETARAVRGARVWLTNEHLHNGLRADGARILDRLIAMARGRA
ncbi:alpha/beta fold hydrolase [Quadrisphaera sp. DSM 44207]|uniref:alpha/beta fold hydrolase n=1 Tax=Quadrisphaera sp. DSM 44207 TaxID=1881057 RepID=UPI00088645FB|nr:alpha/beta fold hydrolase [Quadrisphaera sp. DSM 44207]SDQ35159.1 alpha/beta hydrolase fold [Quadrisphaera sp. DSM 44207]